METQSKSDFIRGQFRQDGSASLQSVRAAWAAAGNSDPIWPTIYYRIRREFGKGRPRRRQRVIRRGSSVAATDTPSRREFIEKNLLENPKATFAEINELWITDGFAGSLSPASYYNARRALGLTRPRRGANQPSRTTDRQNAASFDPLAGYLSIEQTLDLLIADAGRLGDANLTEDLRQARRRVSKVLV